MTQDDIQAIKALLNDESDTWRLDAGDWIGYVEELVDEVERLRAGLDTIRMHSHHDIIDSDCFACVAETEFEQVMSRVFGS